MAVEWRYLYLLLSDVFAAKDWEGARRVIDFGNALKPVVFDPQDPVAHAFRMVVAQRDGEVGWLEEAEESLARNVPRHGPQSAEIDGALAAYLLAGIMRLPDPAAAERHFDAALSLRPDFLPALVEKEILRTGVDRDQIFAAIGHDLPRNTWRYKLAASELGIAGPAGEGSAAFGAICIRGMCTPETPAIVRLHRHFNPGVPIYLATWNTTDPAILEAISAIAKVVLAEDPPIPGAQNKNRQMTLVRAVLAAAEADGHACALLLRTDIALFTPHILASLSSIHRQYPAPPGGFYGRLIITDMFTRKYLPFHISDIMAYGFLPDLIRFWAAPFEVEETIDTTEQYLAQHLYEGLGLRVEESPIKAYHRFLRDYFVLRDFSGFDGFWGRYPDRADASVFRFGDACLSQKEWERLYHAPDIDYLDSFGALESGMVLEAALGLSRF